MSDATDLVVIDSLNAKLIFAPGGVDKILDEITSKVRATKTDISTLTGRAEIASLAYKVARSKTALDELGKNLVAELKKTTSAVDAERRTIRDRLDALKDEVRKPLTDWENDEKSRVEGHEKAISDIHALEIFEGIEPSSAQIHERRLLLGQMRGRDWQEFLKRATDAEAATDAVLERMFVAAKKREDETAELARLRAEQIERERREREERIAAEAAERARKAAEERAAAEAASVAAAARKEKEHIEWEKIQAEDRARKAEADRIAAIAKAEADQRTAAEAAERKRIAAVEAERKRAADEKAAEVAAAARREANKRHAAKIHNEARDALMKTGVTTEQATAIIIAIARDEIPHISISY